MLTGNRHHPCRLGCLQDRRYGRVRLCDIPDAKRLTENLRAGTKLQEIGREWVGHIHIGGLKLSALTKLRGLRRAADAGVDGELPSLCVQVLINLLISPSGSVRTASRKEIDDWERD
jgi:hypothetical protein